MNQKYFDMLGELLKTKKLQHSRMLKKAEENKDDKQMHNIYSDWAYIINADMIILAQVLGAEMGIIEK